MVSDAQPPVETEVRQQQTYHIKACLLEVTPELEAPVLEKRRQQLPGQAEKQ